MATSDTFSDLDGDTAARVTADVAQGISPEQSRWAPYTAPMLRYRRAIEDDIARMPAGSVVDIASELPPLDIVAGTLDDR